MMILITGGSGCGKSSFAENLLLRLPAPRYYVAAMQPYSEEILKKTKRHQEERAAAGIRTLERYTDLAGLILPERGTALLECVCNLISNEMFDEEGTIRDPSDAVISGVQVRSFGAPVIGFEYDTHQPHPRNRLSIADCQVVDGAPAVHLKSGAIRAQIHDCHLQSVPEHPAIRIDKGANLLTITNNVLSAKTPIFDSSGPKAQKTISGNLFEK
jgi:hypothetical protein